MPPPPVSNTNNGLSPVQTAQASPAKTTLSPEESSFAPPRQQLQVGEILSRRSQNAKHYYNANGKFTAEISSGPIHYKDDKGQWQDIVNNLVQSDLAGFQFKNAANEFKTHFAGNSSASPLVKVQAKQVSLTLAPVNAGAAAGTSSGPSVAYRGAVASGTADLRYTVKNEGLKQDIILNSYKTNSFQFRLSAEGFRPELAKNGSLVLYNTSNVEVARAQKPYAIDAKGKITRQANFTLAKEGTGHILTITVDQTWLQAKDRAYPVVIDPWWTFIRGAYQDCWIGSLWPDTNLDAYDLYVGVAQGGSEKDRTLVKFDLSSIPVEQRIIGAQFWMKLHSSLDSTYLKAQAYKVTTNWEEGTVTWNYPWTTIPGGTPGGICDWTPPLPGPPASFYNTALGNGNSDRATWWVTDIAREWYASSAANFGLLVKAENESIVNWKGYYSTETASGDTGFMPTLWVMYEAGFAGIQDYWNYVSFPLGDGQVAMVNVAGGNLVLKHRDWSLSSTGIDTVIDRIYNSSDGQTHDFGYGTMASIHPEMSAFPTALPRAPLFFDPGATWYAFEPIPDANGNPLNTYYRPRGLKAILDKNGSDYLVKYDSGITFKYNSSYRLLTTYDRHSDGVSTPNILQYGYDASGKLTSVTDTVGRTLTFNRASGNIDAISDWIQPSPRTTSYSYVATPASFTNQRGYQTQYSTLPNGSGIGIKDPKNQSAPYNTAEITWADPLGWWNRVGTFSYVKPNGDRDTYTFNYYTDTHETFVTDQNGHQMMYKWDPSSGAVTQILEPGGLHEDRSYGNNFNLKQLVDMDGSTWTYNYDVNDEKLTATVDPVGVTAQYNYSDPINPYFPTRIIDEQKSTTNFTYFSNGNLQNIGFKLNNVDYSATYNYNANGTLNTSTDPRNYSTHYYYTQDPNLNQYGDLRQITDPLNLTITMGYDKASRMIQKIDANGHTTTYSYDNQDNVTSISYAGGTSISFVFDANGNLQSMTDGYGTTTFEYDYRNQVIRKTLPGSPPQVFQFEYDRAGNLTKKIYGSNMTQYTYNYRKLLETVTDNGRTIVDSITYFNDRIPSNIHFPVPDMAVTSTPNGANRLLNITSKKGTNIIAQYDYTYQKSGVETALRQSVTYSATGKPSEATNYSYDEMNHLTQANTVSPVKNRSWTYDANGNRIQQTIYDGLNTQVTNYVYDEISRLNTRTIVGQDPEAYEWDNNCNFIRKGGDLPIEYDNADRAIKWWDHPRVYTGRDQTERVSMEGPRSFLYDGKDTTPVVQTSVSNTLRFITSPAGDLLAVDVSGTLYYYIFDGSGSVVGLVDSTGTLVNQYKYEPFGATTIMAEAVIQPYKFHGGYYDDFGFYKMGARYYDTAIGRFTQPEPAWSNPMFNTLGGRNLLVARAYSTGATVGQGTVPMPGGYYMPATEYNWYSYADSNPVMQADISGYNPAAFRVIAVALALLKNEAKRIKITVIPPGPTTFGGVGGTYRGNLSISFHLDPPGIWEPAYHLQIDTKLGNIPSRSYRFFLPYPLSPY